MLWASSLPSSVSSTQTDLMGRREKAGEEEIGVHPRKAGDMEGVGWQTAEQGAR